MKGGNAVNESLLIPDHAEERDHIRHKCRSDTRSGDKTPANAGPTARARLNSIPLSAEAASRSSFATNSGRTARHVGVSKASPAESANVSASRHQTSNGQDGQRDRDADHPAFGEENQLAAVNDVSSRTRRKRQEKERQG